MIFMPRLPEWVRELQCLRLEDISPVPLAKRIDDAQIVERKIA
jgi:hypothetical protein